MGSAARGAYLQFRLARLAKQQPQTGYFVDRVRESRPGPLGPRCEPAGDYSSTDWADPERLLEAGFNRMAEGAAEPISIYHLVNAIVLDFLTNEPVPTIAGIRRAPAAEQ